jgi:hypothetical protein
MPAQRVNDHAGYLDGELKRCEEEQRRLKVIHLHWRQPIDSAVVKT